MIISNSTMILKITSQLKKYQNNTRRIPNIFITKLKFNDKMGSDNN